MNYRRLYLRKKNREIFFNRKFDSRMENRNTGEKFMKYTFKKIFKNSIEYNEAK